MKARIFLCEAGLALFDESGEPLGSFRFQGDMYAKFRDVLASKTVEELSMLAEQAKASGITELLNPYEELNQPLKAAGVEAVASGGRADLEASKEELMVKSGLVFSRDEVLDIVRDFAVKQSEQKIREKSARLDLQVVQSIAAVDELDKTINLVSARVREWYGLHFPELDNLVQDPIGYCRMVAELGRRDGFNEGSLKSTGFSEAKTAAVAEAARRSKGGEARQEDIEEVAGLASEAVALSKLRDRMMKHVERNMQALAPNVTAIAGAAIGARLIAKAGGQEKLARLPSSTIQVLGAEKALFRALKSGGRPPKHGLLFQHAMVHSASEWQRGKVARALASKLAIGARIDYFRGDLDKSLTGGVERKVQQIREKYPAPKPRKEKPRFVRDNRRRRWR
ncbi:MAG: C/D box methylation guide ribonucleoprotein complex aNOP56 subunit [Nitrososphaerota archaeon]|nr:C/D box methylation guide ribonucleoprotein complex aNOP56 subunit [Nitrososphaerota archaeon]